MDAFIGEIRGFGGVTAPRGWLLCDGQLLNIAENDALFGVIGNAFGGDGTSTFALPDLRGRIPAHRNHGEPLGVARDVAFTDLGWDDPCGGASPGAPLQVVSYIICAVGEFPQGQ